MNGKNLFIIFFIFMSNQVISQKSIKMEFKDILGYWKICSETNKNNLGMPELDVAYLECYNLIFQKDELLEITSGKDLIGNYNWKLEIDNQTITIESKSKINKKFDGKYKIEIYKIFENINFFLVDKNGTYYRLTK